MTAILAHWVGEANYGIAADSQVTSEDGDIFYVSKLYVKGKVCIGVSGDSSVGFCAEEVLKVRTTLSGGALKKAVTRAWCKALRVLHEASPGDGKKAGPDMRMIMVSPSGVYFFDASANGYVEEIAGDLDGDIVCAAGVGGTLALMAWKVSPNEDGNIDDKDRLRFAVSKACELNAMCGGQVYCKWWV